MKTDKLLLLIISVLFNTSCYATITLPAIFSDGMVLQQKSEAMFWGKADPGEKIFITTGWSIRASTIADADGKWQTIIQTPAASGPYEVTLSGNNSLVLKDILIGEVWLCSGQSNMAFKLKGAENGAQEIADADFTQIRFLKVKQIVVWSEESNIPVEIRYAWLLADEGNISNSAGLPAYPFRKIIHAINR